MNVMSKNLFNRKFRFAQFILSGFGFFPAANDFVTLSFRWTQTERINGIEATALVFSHGFQRLYYFRF